MLLKDTDITIIVNSIKKIKDEFRDHIKNSNKLTNKFSTTFTTDPSNSASAAIASAASDSTGNAIKVSLLNAGVNTTDANYLSTTLFVPKLKDFININLDNFISNYGQSTTNIIFSATAVSYIITIMLLFYLNLLDNNDNNINSRDSFIAAFNSATEDNADAVTVAVAAINVLYDTPEFRNTSINYPIITSAASAAFATYLSYTTSNEISTASENAAAAAGLAAGNSGFTAVTNFSSLPCFTAGSMILTPNGYKKVEDFKNGDLIQTPDHRSVPVKTKITHVVITTKENAPYLIPKGSLGHGIPKQDLRLSPSHAIRISKGVWVIPRLAKDIFKQIKQYDVGKPITYYHLETPNFYKDHLVCNESIVESYSGKQMDSLKQELYYQKNLYAHYLSGLSSEESKDSKEGYSDLINENTNSIKYLYLYEM
jgi:hypothetical protein